MKKIIDGKLYNTETATFIAEWDNGLNFTDFNYVDKTLYQTQKGNFFLQFEGGCMSHYGKHVGGNGYAMRGLLPFTNEEAADWLEEHGFAVEYEEYFGAEEA